MGDRCNFVFSDKAVKPSATLQQAMSGQIVLYSHWGGSERRESLMAGLLAGKGRWSDDA
jgi:hypothetical protein